MFHVMEKIDAWTPWHSLRAYATLADAMYQAAQWAKSRKAGEKYPQYSVDGRKF